MKLVGPQPSSTSVGTQATHLQFQCTQCLVAAMSQLCKFFTERVELLLHGNILRTSQRYALL